MPPGMAASGQLLMIVPPRKDFTEKSAIVIPTCVHPYVSTPGRTICFRQRAVPS